MNWRFVIALAVAAAWRIWVVVKEVGSQASGIYTALRDARKPQFHVEPELQRKRLAACESCLIFYKPLRTCGSPLLRKSWPKDASGKVTEMGCFCFMPAKVKTKTNCHLYDLTEGSMGWPDELNSFPVKTHLHDGNASAAVV